MVPELEPLKAALHKQALALNKSLSKLRSRQNTSEQEMLEQKKLYH